MGATKEAFDDEGWFKTGDIAVYNPLKGKRGSIKILGRASADIIKCNAYKISALEIETVLKDYESIAEVAVLGKAHDVMGEEITAIIRLKQGCTILKENENELSSSLRTFCKHRIAPYKIPTLYYF